MSYKPMKFYLTPASIPQVVAHIQKYLEENPIVSEQTVQEIIRIAIAEDPDLFNGSIIPIDGDSDLSIKEYIDQLSPTVDAYTKAETDAMFDEVDADLALKANAADTYTKTETDAALALKANAADTYTKTETDAALALKANAAVTYTKTQVDDALNLKANKTETYTKTAVDNLLATKENLLTFDVTPTHDSLNPVTSSGILNSLSTLNESIGEQLALKANSADVNTALAQKQNTLTFDTTPTYGSLNPVTSDGIYKSEFYEPGETLDFRGDNFTFIGSSFNTNVLETTIQLPKRIDTNHVSNVGITLVSVGYVSGQGYINFDVSQITNIQVKPYTNVIVLYMTVPSIPLGTHSVIMQALFTFNA